MTVKAQRCHASRTVKDSITLWHCLLLVPALVFAATGLAHVAMLALPLLIDPLLIIIIHVGVIEKIVVGWLGMMALHFCVTFSFIVCIIIGVEVYVVIKRCLGLFGAGAADLLASLYG